MGAFSSKYSVRSIVPYNFEDTASEVYIMESPNLTKRRIKRTHSKIIIDGLTNAIP